MFKRIDYRFRYRSLCWLLFLLVFCGNSFSVYANDIERKYQNAVKLFKAKKLKEAEKLLNEVVEADENHAKAWYGLGLCGIKNQSYFSAIYARLNLKYLGSSLEPKLIKYMKQKFPEEFKGNEKNYWDYSNSENAEKWKEAFKRVTSKDRQTFIRFELIADQLKNDPFSMVIRFARADLVKGFIDEGIDPDMPLPCGKLPIMIAVANWSDGIKTDVIELLLAKRVKLNFLDKDGLSPLHFTVLPNQTKVAKLLLKAGADPNLRAGPDLNAQTPLHLAAKFKKKEIAVILLEAGGDVNQKDNDGKTPLDYAKSTGDSDLLNLFTEK